MRITAIADLHVPLELVGTRASDIESHTHLAEGGITIVRCTRPLDVVGVALVASAPILGEG